MFSPTSVVIVLLFSPQFAPTAACVICVIRTVRTTARHCYPATQSVFVSPLLTVSPLSDFPLREDIALLGHQDLWQRSGLSSDLRGGGVDWKVRG